PAHFSHGAAAPSFRAQRLGGAQSYRALLDHDRDSRSDRSREPQDPLMLAMSTIDGMGTRAGAARRTLVAGLGATGIAAANFLAARGVALRVIDSRERPPGLDALRKAQPALDIVTG